MSCPKCGGTTGYEGWLTETHRMNGEWGDSPEAVDSGFKVHYSLMQCADCGAKVSIKTAEKKRKP